MRGIPFSPAAVNSGLSCAMAAVYTTRSMESVMELAICG